MINEKMLTAAEEILIRKANALKFANAANIGQIIPAPVYFKDKADYFAQIGLVAVDTKKEIERTNIAFCVLSLLKFEDSPRDACEDNPLIRLTYNAYIFRQYDFEREDETDTPDDFLKTTLKSYNTFIETVLSARNEFLGPQPLETSLDANFEVNSNSLVQTDYIRERDVCRYIPSLQGHSVDLQTITEVLIRED